MISHRANTWTQGVRGTPWGITGDVYLQHVDGFMSEQGMSIEPRSASACGTGWEEGCVPHSEQREAFSF